MKTLLSVIAVLVLAGSVCRADEITGKVAAVDTAGKTITISGVTVAGADARVYRPVNQTLPFTALAAGNVVKIHGDFSGPAQMNARRIEIVASAHGRIEGTIEKTDTATRTVTISGIAVTIPLSAELKGGHTEHHQAAFDIFSPGMVIECKGNWSGAASFNAREVDIKE